MTLLTINEIEKYPDKVPSFEILLDVENVSYDGYYSLCSRDVYQTEFSKQWIKAKNIEKILVNLRVWDTRFPDKILKSLKNFPHKREILLKPMKELLDSCPINKIQEMIENHTILSKFESDDLEITRPYNFKFNHAYFFYFRD